MSAPRPEPAQDPPREPLPGRGPRGAGPGAGAPRLWLFRALLVAFNLLLFGGFYLGTVAWRSQALHAKQGRWVGRAYRPHKQYGHFPRRRGQAYHSLEHGELVPVVFDGGGFRVPVKTPAAPPGAPRLLFLGDSFTHGYGVAAEKTFPFLTARKVGAVALNAGVSGWGLSQMVLRARAEIPRVKPDLIVVQHSSWLAARSMGFYGPTRGALAPSPYFFEDHGRIAIQPPVFTSRLFSLPLSEHSQEGLLPFAWHVGLPLFAYEDWSVLRTSMRRALGRLPRPARSEPEVLRFAYGEISRLCAEHGAAMVVLVLPHRIHDRAAELTNVPPEWIVPTLEELTRGLPEPNREAWENSYQLWRGDPPQLVDRHPSPRMHAAIAKILARAIEGRLQTSPLLETAPEVPATSGAAARERAAR